MKRIILKICVSIFIFVGTVIVSEILMNSGNVNTTKDMEQASLPVIYMNIGGETANELHGYVSQGMQIGQLRDSITPLDEKRGTSFRIMKHGQTIDAIEVQIRTIDGSRLIESIQVTDYSEDDYAILAAITFKDLIEDNTEYSMLIYLTTSTGQKVMYCTHVIMAPSYCTSEKIAFIMDFHEKSMKEETAGELKQYMETNYTGDNTTLAKVNIHSSLKQLYFNGLDVEEVTKPTIKIKEIAEQTAVCLVQYVARIKDGDRENYYFVEEYYRTKYMVDFTYLLDYERTMCQITDERAGILAGDKIVLGITDSNINLCESDGGTVIAFINQNKLYTYNITAKKFAKLFSFYDSANFDERTYNDSHKIKILSVDETGNVSFLVYGYLNRGEHEGCVGITLYYYNGIANAVEEQLYVGYNKSHEMLMNGIDELAYLSKSGIFYFMMDKTIYGVDMETKKVEELVTNLQEGKYRISDSQRMAAWQTNEDVNASDQLMLMNLNTKQISRIKAPSEQYIKPLEFMGEDLIYGLAYRNDVTKDSAGRTTFPMYCLRIQNEYGEVLKVYREEGIYTTEVTTNGKLISLTRVQKVREDDITDVSYERADDDYLTNNQEVPESRNKVVPAVYGDFENIIQIQVKNEIDKTSTLFLTPKEVIYEGSKEVTVNSHEIGTRYYYVYFKGKLQGVYTSPANAVTMANNNYGTVVNNSGYYVWYRANRQQRNQIMEITGDKITEEKNSLAISLDTLMKYENVIRNSEYLLSQGETVISILRNNLEDVDVLDLTGCSLDSVLYYVDRDLPVLALMHSGEAMLIIGFNQLNVVVMDPNKGEVYKIGMNEANDLFEQNGNRFITYVQNEIWSYNE